MSLLLYIAKQRHPNNEEERPPTKPIATQHERGRTNKITQTGGDFGEDEEDAVRVLVDDRGQDEETLGKRKPLKGLRFPAPEREREESDKRCRRKTQKQKERGYNCKAHRGESRRAKRPNIIPTQATKKKGTMHNTENKPFDEHRIGNGRNIFSRVLFRGRELTEPH